ncbi:MAG: hypothetical protein OXI67_10100 [Candidatus Poribacteria bacterium]|nr:hypothetical protein [Candidatus Poribacteria bacterium]
MYRYPMTFIIMLVLLTSVIAIQDADPHWDLKRVYNVTEACWVIGYSSEGRTFCQYNRYVLSEHDETLVHHMGVHDPQDNSVTIIIHQPGHDDHGTRKQGPYRRYRVRTVYTDCGECS